MIELVIFDMAGTVINENNIVYKTIQKAINSFGYDVILDVVLEHSGGKEKRQAIADTLKNSDVDFNEDTIDDIHAKFKELLNEAYMNGDISYFPEVQMVIMTLRKSNIKVAFNTGYSKSVLDVLVDKIPINIPEDADMIVCADDVENQRPHADMIDLICDTLDVKPEHSIKVGDSIIDIEEGKNAGVKYSVGITTGAHTKEQLNSANPDFIINNISEVLQIVKQ